jgi:predicted amidophosphoribosyltransferase
MAMNEDQERGRRCPICDAVLGPWRRCPNYWCGRDDRGFDTVWAIGEHRGELRHAIAALKYRGEGRYAVPLGRLLAGFRVEQAPAFDDVGVIVGMPGTMSWARPCDHTGEIVSAACSLIGDLWRIDTALLAKTEPTRPLMGTTAGLRRLRAAGELRPSLAVTDPGAVAGLRVLAVDDVFTDGSTLPGGGRRAAPGGRVGRLGLVLARQPLRPPGGPEARIDMA